MKRPKRPDTASTPEDANNTQATSDDWNALGLSQGAWGVGLKIQTEQSG